MSPEEQEEEQHSNPSHDHAAKAAGKKTLLSLLSTSSLDMGRLKWTFSSQAENVSGAKERQTLFMGGLML